MPNSRLPLLRHSGRRGELHQTAGWPCGWGEPPPVGARTPGWPRGSPGHSGTPRGRLSRRRGVATPSLPPPATFPRRRGSSQRAPSDVSGRRARYANHRTAARPHWPAASGGGRVWRAGWLKRSSPPGGGSGAGGSAANCVARCGRAASPPPLRLRASSSSSSRFFFFFFFFELTFKYFFFFVFFFFFFFSFGVAVGFPLPSAAFTCDQWMQVTHAPSLLSLEVSKEEEQKKKKIDLLRAGAGERERGGARRVPQSAAGRAHAGRSTAKHRAAPRSPAPVCAPRARSGPRQREDAGSAAAAAPRMCGASPPPGAGGK